MSSEDISYVASGFHEDCVRLIEIFKNQESIRFEAFITAWQEMKFSLVFLFRKNFAEMLEFAEESLNVAKQFVLHDDLIDQIGGLYILYGMYYKMPVSNVKIRVTSKEWQHVMNLHKQIKDEKLYDANYIFVKLVADNAFHHCLFAAEYGLEKSFKFHQDISSDNPFSVLPSLVNEMETGELSKIEKLSKMYDEQKAKLLNNMSSKNKLQLFDKNFVDEISNQIDSIQDKRQNLLGLRKKSKELPTLAKSNNSCLAKHKYVDDKIRPKLGHGFDTDSSDDENMDMQFAFVKVDNQKLQFNEKDETDPSVDGDENDHSKVEESADESNDDEMP